MTDPTFRKAARRKHDFQMMPLGRQNSSALVGVVLIGFGAILLLKNFGIFRIRDIVDFWPLLPILWGVQAIARCRSTFTLLVGGMAIGLGAIKLLDNLGVIEVSSKLYGPIILIALGVAFLVKNLQRDSTSNVGGVSNEAVIHPMVMFGGVKRRVDSQAFEGGEIMAFFGGVEIDFRKAKMKGDTASVEANALFGGCHLRVPESWTVEIRGTGAFGGYDDKTIPPRAEDGLPMQRLILTGNAMFGGISIEN